PVHMLSMSILFFSQQRRPPLSTLFPYTPLFRSTDEACASSPPSSASTSSTTPSRVEPATWPTIRAATRPSPSSTTVDGTACSGTDRKSTRLNSSHVKISYAVFCLKKKNSNTYEQ